jgi:hypothetical protein
MKSLFSYVNRVIVGEETKDPPRKVVLPWDDYQSKAKELGIKGNLTEAMKARILEIANDEEALLREVEFEFELDQNVEVIMELMTIDATLRDAFRRLVPSKTNEQAFWRSYFSMVEEAKNAVLKKLVARPQAKSDRDILDELESELTDLPMPPRVPKKPKVSLETQLKDAITRITALEATVQKLEAKVAELSTPPPPPPQES